MRNKKGQFIDGLDGIYTRFTRERSLGNQNAKGNPPNATTFKSENIQLEKHPCWKGGLQKCRDAYFVAYETKKRMARGRWNWINTYGEIPRGMIIWHIDMDRYNDDINNLECITRAECVRRNSKHY